MLTEKTGVPEIVADYAEDYITELAESGAAIEKLRHKMKNFAVLNGWRGYVKERGITGYNGYGNWTGEFRFGGGKR
jgi:hypothetical protein